MVRAPTPDVGIAGSDRQVAVLVSNCVTRHEGPVGPSAAWPSTAPSLDAAIEPSEVVAPSVPPLDPSEPLPGEPSTSTAPSGERSPAAMGAASSAAIDGA